MKNDKYLEFMKKIIVKAGKETLKYYGKKNFAYNKGSDNSVVTLADLASNKIILSAIKKNFPTHGIISEEEKDYQRDAEYVWVIDPVDGTKNFANEIPLYAVMMALMKNNVPICVGIYLPYFGDLYYASKGNGAYKNDKKISCSNRTLYDHSYGVLSLSGMDKYERQLKNMVNGITYNNAWASSYICIGVAAAYASEGKFDWLVFPHAWDGFWDFLIPILLLEESGCTVTGLDGKKWIVRKDLSIVAANPALHKIILSNINK